LLAICTERDNLEFCSTSPAHRSGKFHHTGDGGEGNIKDESSHNNREH